MRIGVARRQGKSLSRKTRIRHIQTRATNSFLLETTINWPPKNGSPSTITSSNKTMDKIWISGAWFILESPLLLQRQSRYGSCSLASSISTPLVENILMHYVAPGSKFSSRQVKRWYPRVFLPPHQIIMRFYLPYVTSWRVEIISLDSTSSPGGSTHIRLSAFKRLTCRARLYCPPWTAFVFAFFWQGRIQR